ncbi:hypothetical protein CTAM01_10164 [Colletotrichum tamarilloi]|uniref:2EXR domain-containing protein n=1 Tax=Colletotrichum tamarilloi TaxID=1209934 RepID=A0ABQ9R140_9PEZI|nr:uncharacterized protein CTAM01_10164 [Colletotrichum tamarilloi]KAK1491841.1 hypothetical protein CTAM01_10164 [Colletotrichum tamarilloi]
MDETDEHNGMGDPHHDVSHTLPQPASLITDLADLDLFKEVRPRTFHLFKDLPPEIRTKIWRLAAPKPAVVERISNSTTLAYGLHRPVPALLQVCQESRAEMLYDPENPRGLRDEQFEMLHLSRGHQAQGKGVYMNYRHDTLLIYRGPAQSIMPSALSFINLRHLAMEWGLRPCWVQDHCHKGVRLLRQFPNLKTITLLVTFHLFNALPLGESGRKHREQTQKRRALNEIKSWVLGEIDQALEQDANARVAAAAEAAASNDANIDTNYGPSSESTSTPSAAPQSSTRTTASPAIWNPPEVRVVPKTKYWSMPASA